MTLLCARIRLVGCWLDEMYVFGRFQILSSGQIRLGRLLFPNSRISDFTIVTGLRLLEQVGLQKKLHRGSNAGYIPDGCHCVHKLYELHESGVVD